MPERVASLESIVNIGAGAGSDSLGIVMPEQLFGRVVRDGEILKTGLCDPLSQVEPMDPLLTVERAFGSATELVASQREAIPYVEALTDHPIFQAVVLIVTLAYMLMVCANLNELYSLWSHETRSEGSFISSRTLQSASALGVIMVGAIGVNLLNSTPAYQFGAITLLLAIAFGITLLFAAQSLILILAGTLTLSSDLTSQLIKYKINNFGLATLLAMPFAILGVLSETNKGMIWLWLAGAIALIVTILFIKDSFLLFIQKKVSILHWFLYLCTVELLPISFIYLSAIRW